METQILLEHVVCLRTNGAAIRDRHAQDTRLLQPSDGRHMGYD